MAKHSSNKYILFRRRNKNLASESQALGTSLATLKTENIKLLERIAKLEVAKPRPKRGLRVGWVYFFGFIAGAFLAVVAIFLMNYMTLSLEIPDGIVKDVVVLSGTQVSPEAFLSDTDITAEFNYPIDFFHNGKQEVVLLLQSGRRVGKATASINILEPLMSIQIEAGTPPSYITPLSFVPLAYNADVDIAIHSGLPEAEGFRVGRHIVTVSVNGSFFHPEIIVLDTTPPTAVLTDVIVPMGQAVELDDFVVEYFDESPVVDIWFLREPDVFNAGEQLVEIGFEDYFGNQAIYSAVLTVRANAVPPQIFGTRDIQVQIGSPIIFRMGVSAEDAFGRSLEFFVDSSALNINELGEYTVIYYTIDAWGLRTEVEITVTVLEVDPERVRYLAQAVLDNILYEGMTQVQEARAIFDWIQNNVAYAANISRGSVYEGAYQALRNRRGDCFVFYSISEVMLTLAGIPNMHIQRIADAPSRHSWNLINPDGLGWYHFDATPMQPVHNQRLNRFMFTSSQAREHTITIARELLTPDYYTYYPELYPEIVQ